MKYECLFPIRKASSIFSLKLGFLKTHNAAAPASPHPWQNTAELAAA
jgi:hypothetical protein